MSTTKRLHSNPPFHAEHVGSLLRTPQLLEKRAEFTEGKISAEQLRAAQDEGIASVVKLQQELGVNGITDGEYRRDFFFEGMFENLEGMSFVKSRPMEDFQSFLPYVRFYNAVGMKAAPSIFTDSKIKRTKGIHTEDFKYLKSLVSPEEVKNLKTTICSPIWLHLRHGSELTYDFSVYKNDDEYFADLLQAYREEIEELYSLGSRYIQIDDPSFCFFCDEIMISDMEKAGIDHEGMLGGYIKRYNDLLRGLPSDLTMAIHMCRGNFRGMHYSEGGYDRIAAKLFNDLDMDCFYLEYDNERSGTLDPLAHFPLGKSVVLGFVTTKNGQLETPEELKARVARAVDVISEGTPKRSKAEALRQICISPQCGFASVAEGNPISLEEEKAKLSLLVQVAKEIWGQ